jgi:hypothetical protein
VAYIGKKKNAYSPFVGQPSRKRLLEKPTVRIKERILFKRILKKQSQVA